MLAKKTAAFLPFTTTLFYLQKEDGWLERFLFSNRFIAGGRVSG